MPNKRKHGLSKTPEYKAWRNMINRCDNPNNQRYSQWGGRGIKVCDRWYNFLLFLEDLGYKPSASHSLDRIDNNKGYNPENCKWSSKREQVLNRRKQSNNSSGYKGISWDNTHKKWRAFIYKNGKTISLGYFESKQDAIEARKKVEQAY